MTLLPILLVALVLVFAIVRPRGLPEIVIAGPAAVVVLLTGVVTLDEARDELASMAPTVVFLVAVLVLAHAADALGVFRWVSQILQQKSLADPHRLLIYVFGAAALTTAVLSLDATVVLLTPAVIAAARCIGASPRPHSYASAHLSNSASTLLPVSNLTNLIAFAATGLTFLHFTALMALPWVVTIAVEYLIFRLFFRSELARGDSAEPPVAARSAPAPILPLTVIGMTLLGFAVSGFFGIEPAWIAVVGASVLGAIALARHRTTAAKMLYAADLWFCAFVLVLGIIVAGVANGPVGEWIAQILPGDTSYGSLLFVAAVAAVGVQSRQQPAGNLADDRSARNGGTSSAGACDVDRRQPRPQPHLRGLTGNDALATSRHQRGRTAHAGDIHSARGHHDATDIARRRECPVVGDLIRG